MRIGVGADAYVEGARLGKCRDQLAEEIGEAVGVGCESAAAGCVATQRHDLANARLGVASRDLQRLLAGGVDASQMRRNR